MFKLMLLLFRIKGMGKFNDKKVFASNGYKG